MVIVGGANLSVMTWSSRTCRNVTKVARSAVRFVNSSERIAPSPSQWYEIDRDGATVRERIGAAASKQTKCDCDSGYLVANQFRSRASFRRPQCFSFREGSNTRSM